MPISVIPAGSVVRGNTTQGGSTTQDLSRFGINIPNPNQVIGAAQGGQTLTLAPPPTTGSVINPAVMENPQLASVGSGNVIANPPSLIATMPNATNAQSIMVPSVGTTIDGDPITISALSATAINSNSGVFTFGHFNNTANDVAIPFISSPYQGSNMLARLMTVGINTMITPSINVESYNNLLHLMEKIGNLFIAGIQLSLTSPSGRNTLSNYQYYTYNQSFAPNGQFSALPIFSVFSDESFNQLFAVIMRNSQLQVLQALALQVRSGDTLNVSVSLRPQNLMVP